ncbi:methionyl-tRNA formyltransferase [Flavobacteriaceae bacterium 14752]|uniref:methionyl-tRNA formyltransferase n=1 Tax=Mesohalobacter salilacus TaxID=2491711 RepID=UPI000F62CC19|nr:methionyl-tRNA formyltransferase [Flavobacteriaceae bacterium 14752]
MRALRILFMGTPEFSVPMLESIHQSEHKLLATVTAPDKPAGRGRKLNKSAVKLFAEQHNINVLQPTNLKSEDFFSQLKALNPNLIVVVAFRMLPKQVWQFPEFGTFNLHASLLPHYRGAAPINWAIINGETQTGLTTFFIDDKIDTGHVIDKISLPILETDNVEDVYNKMLPKGVELILETLEKISKNKIDLKPQSDSENLKIAPKLNKDNTKIDWSQSGQDIYNLVRGLSPFPLAWSTLDNINEKINCKISKVSFQKESHELDNGQIILKDKNWLVAVKDGYIKIEKIKLSGKRLLKTSDLLNGFTINDGAMMK